MKSSIAIAILFLSLTLNADWKSAEAYMTAGRMNEAYTAFIMLAHTEEEPGKKALAYIQASRAKFAQGATDEARSLVRLALAIDPGLDPARIKPSPEFLTFFQNLASQPPVDFDANVEMAAGKLRDGSIDASIADLNSLIGKGYAFREVFQLLGDAYLQQGNLEMARKIYAKALQSEAFKTEKLLNDPNYRLARAVEAYRGGDYERALDLLPPDLEDPNAAAFRLSLLARMKKYDKLLSYLSNHREFRETHKEFRFLYAVLLNTMGEREEAVRELLNIVRDDRFWVDPRLALARIYREEKNEDLARTYYRQTSMLEPMNAPHLLEYCTFLIVSGDESEAREPCAAAYQYAEEQDDVIPWYAFALFKTDDTARAKKLLIPYTKRHTGEEWTKTLLALIYLKEGSSNACITLMHDASTPLQKRLLARCRLAHGEPTAALALVESVEKESRASLQDRAVIFMKNNRSEEGLTALLREKDLDPEVKAQATHLLDAIRAMQP